MKRLLDVIVGVFALIVLAPVYFAIFLAINMETSGGAIFRQERVGLNGNAFMIHKFRTMHAGVQGLLVSTTQDPRITNVGRFLRNSKLDELPQFFDVVRGKMSVVGPRPEVPQYVALWPEELKSLILSVRPGITDPATVELRHEAALLGDASNPDQAYIELLLPRKVKIYAEYVRNRSLRTDAIVLLRTAKVLFSTASTNVRPDHPRSTR